MRRRTCESGADGTCGAWAGYAVSYPPAGRRRWKVSVSIPTPVQARAIAPATPAAPAASPAPRSRLAEHEVRAPVDRRRYVVGMALEFGAERGERILAEPELEQRRGRHRPRHHCGG